MPGTTSTRASTPPRASDRSSDADRGVVEAPGRPTPGSRRRRRGRAAPARTPPRAPRATRRPRARTPRRSRSGRRAARARGPRRARRPARPSRCRSSSRSRALTSGSGMPPRRRTCRRRRSRRRCAAPATASSVTWSGSPGPTPMSRTAWDASVTARGPRGRPRARGRPAASRPARRGRASPTARGRRPRAASRRCRAAPRGWTCRMKSWLVSSRTYSLASVSYIQSCTTPGGGVEAEEVVDGRGELEGALVAVALHRADPARVDHAGPEDPVGLLLQGPGADGVGGGRVADVGLGVGAGQRAHGGDHAAVVLEVVVASRRCRARGCRCSWPRP